MAQRKLSGKNSKEKIRRERDPIPWRYCFLTLICGFFLVVGFFGAARQHFSSIDYGIKNSKLRKQKDDLEAEQRRLLLNKEISLSPAEIKKAAQKLGFTEMTAGNIEVFRSTPDSEPVKPKNERSSESGTVSAFSGKSDKTSRDLKKNGDDPKEPDKVKKKIVNNPPNKKS